MDLESLKALVAPQGAKNVVDRVAKEGSVRLLPGAKRKRGSSLRQVSIERKKILPLLQFQLLTAIFRLLQSEDRSEQLKQS